MGGCVLGRLRAGKIRVRRLHKELCTLNLQLCGFGIYSRRHQIVAIQAHFLRRAQPLMMLARKFAGLSKFFAVGGDNGGIRR